MLSYQQKQFHLFRDLEKKFKQGKKPASIVEPAKDYIKDNRICLTSVVFVPVDIQKNIIQKIINPLKEVDKRQYYYPLKSLHLTIQNIRTINDPPLFNEKDVEKVKSVFKKIIPKHKSFYFELKGLFEMPSSLSICGYSNEAIKYLVLELRDELQKISVPDNKIYASSEIFFGNINVCRYPVNPNGNFVKKVKELKNINISRLEIKKVSLITTNSVCHPRKTKIIDNYFLS